MKAIYLKHIIGLILGLGFIAMAGSSWAENQMAAVKEYSLTAQEITWEPRPGLKLKGWAYNGQIPGPEIRVKQGDQVRVTFTNNLPMPTAIHWHGLDVPADMDGVPGISQDSVQPGETFVYEFIAKQPGTRFYHTHGSGGEMPDEAMQMQMGLYGAFIVEGKNERKADREYTVILSDRNKALDPMNPDTEMEKMEPDLFFLNGKLSPATDHLMVKQGERVRLRLINASSMTSHPMHLHGHTGKVVAIDGNKLEFPLLRDTIPLAPGERYDIEFIADNPGRWAFHCHELHHADTGMATLLHYEGL
jgi:FtsP/CotA-like multicopper oxidase with cupredoxin domain